VMMALDRLVLPALSVLLPMIAVGMRMNLEVCLP
jgi:hypothetical protein